MIAVTRLWLPGTFRSNVLAGPIHEHWPYALGRLLMILCTFGFARATGLRFWKRAAQASRQRSANPPNQQAFLHQGQHVTKPRVSS